jgi:hypothetical protein
MRASAYFATGFLERQRKLPTNTRPIYSYNDASGFSNVRAGPLGIVLGRLASIRQDVSSIANTCGCFRLGRKS